MHPSRNCTRAGNSSTQIQAASPHSRHTASLSRHTYVEAGELHCTGQGWHKAGPSQQLPPHVAWNQVTDAERRSLNGSASAENISRGQQPSLARPNSYKLPQGTHDHDVSIPGRHNAVLVSACIGSRNQLGPGCTHPLQACTHIVLQLPHMIFILTLTILICLSCYKDYILALAVLGVT